jgi:DNA ligase-1
MKFSTLAQYFQKIETVDARLEMTEILSQVFSQTSWEEIDKACYLSLGMLAPKFADLKLQLAEKMMIRCISQVTQVSNEDIVAKFKELGDLGQTYQELISQKPQLLNDQCLSIKDVYHTLVKIAKQEGLGSQERKIFQMSELLKSVDPLSGKFLVRIPLTKLRLGFSALTILDALSWLEKRDKSLRPQLEDAYNIRADIGIVAQIFKKNGLKAIEEITPQTGTPIVPARATPLINITEIFEKMNGKAALEPKFDGFRVQIHVDKNKSLETENSDSLSLFSSQKNELVKVYSRNLDDITFMFPELVEAAKNLPVESVIIDGEAVATDPRTGELLDFQETVKRKRKHNIETIKDEIPLTAFIFDLLLLNGEPLIKKPLAYRRQKLEELFKTTKSSNLTLTQQKLVDKPEEFEDFFNNVADKGLEGLMVKKIDGIYRAGTRDFTWVKYKVGMQSQLADTVDAIVMGYFKGEGKWTKFGLGKVLVGVPSKDEILAISKVGSGFSEDKIIEMVKKANPVIASQKPKGYQVDKQLIPDVWLKPQIVIEIRADSISRSPLYSTGFSLRFPRFIRFREDKDADQATTLEELKVMVQNNK